MPTINLDFPSVLYKNFGIRAKEFYIHHHLLHLLHLLFCSCFEFLILKKKKKKKQRKKETQKGETKKGKKFKKARGKTKK